MSTLSNSGENQIETVVVPRTSDLGGFSVRRAIPSAQRRTVGPFVFLDHMGPVEFDAGSGIDVRPHPHIGLSTVTYLYEGSMVHRDGAGNTQTILPGEVNWMTAGRGIVHSERSSPDSRKAPQRLCGLQIWVGLPKEHEETDPGFTHYGLDAQPAGATTVLPAEHEERAAYLAEGSIEIDGQVFESGRLVVFAPGRPVQIRAVTAARFAVLGGEPLEGPRFLWWNFVSSSKDRIEQAKQDWQRTRFDQIVPGDETEYIPLPEPRA